jgi:hypothetical protein
MTPRYDTIGLMLENEGFRAALAGDGKTGSGADPKARFAPGRFANAGPERHRGV